MKIYKVKDVAQLLNLSKSKVYHSWLELGGRKINGSGAIRFRARNDDDLFDRLTSDSPSGSGKPKRNRPSPGKLRIKKKNQTRNFNQIEDKHGIF